MINSFFYSFFLLLQIKASEKPLGVREKQTSHLYASSWTVSRLTTKKRCTTRIWIAFFFTGIIPRRTLLVWLKHGRVPTVVRPIFVAMMIGHVKTIQKLMLACFRSNYRSIWRTFNEMNHNGKFMLFSSNAGAFQVSHAQSSIPVWQDMLRRFRITCLLVSDRIIGLSGELLTGCVTMPSPYCFRPTRAHFKCRTPNLRYQGGRICKDDSESHARLFQIGL